MVKTLRLRVTMREVVPTVVRVLDVPAGCTLGELHDLLQVALGWTDSHLHLHDALRGSGLLRVTKGVARPTKAVADDLEVLRRVRVWMTKDPYQELLVGDALALLLARGPMSVPDLAAEVHPMLGRWWRTENGPLTADNVRRDLYGLSGLLLGLDLIDRDENIMKATPAAAAFLPRATHLAQLLSGSQ